MASRVPKAFSFLPGLSIAAPFRISRSSAVMERYIPYKEGVPLLYLLCVRCYVKAHPFHYLDKSAHPLPFVPDSFTGIDRFPYLDSLLWHSFFHIVRDFLTPLFFGLFCSNSTQPITLWEPPLKPHSSEFFPRRMRPWISRIFSRFSFLLPPCEVARHCFSINGGGK